MRKPWRKYMHEKKKRIHLHGAHLWSVSKSFRHLHNKREELNQWKWHLMTDDDWWLIMIDSWWLTGDDCWWLMMTDESSMTIDEWWLLAIRFMMIDDDWWFGGWWRVTGKWWVVNWWLLIGGCWLLMIEDEWWWLRTINNRWWLMVASDGWWLVMTDDDRWWLMLTTDDRWYWWWLLMTDDGCCWLMKWLMMIDDDWWWVMTTDVWWLLMIADAEWWWLMMIDGGWLWLMMTGLPAYWLQIKFVRIKRLSQTDLHMGCQWISYQDGVARSARMGGVLLYIWGGTVKVKGSDTYSSLLFPSGIKAPDGWFGTTCGVCFAVPFNLDVLCAIRRTTFCQSYLVSISYPDLS